MNDAGDVVGTSRLDPGCGSTCLPPEETVVWRGGQRVVLPEVPGLSPIFATSMNNPGWVAGFVGGPGTTTHAVVWTPVGDTDQAIDLGNLPGKTISTAAGIDDLGRVVGWSTTQSFPPSGAPFLWTEAGGMVDLTTLGFPLEQPMAISPGGTVGTVDSLAPAAGALRAADLHERGLIARTAIYAPAGLRQPVEHVWRRNGQIINVVRLTPVQGGRRDGFRTFSRKTAFPADSVGRWRVDVTTESGQLIGRLRFRVVP